MVDARPLDGHEHISQAVGFHHAADLGDRRVKALLVVFDHAGWDEDAAVEIGEHPLGTSLGTIHGHDTEVLGADLLDPRVERSGRLDDGEIVTVTRVLKLRGLGFFSLFFVVASPFVIMHQLVFVPFCTHTHQPIRPPRW